MPSTVRDVFAAAGLAPAGCVRWAEQVPEGAPGVYAVALTPEVDSLAAARTACPLSENALDELLRVRPELTVDGQRPTAADLGARLAGLWLGDEVVLYIGLAGTSLRSRLRQYYVTPLGARSPHAGGWPLKTLSVLADLQVHYAPSSNVRGAEAAMLAGFAERVSPETRARLHDPASPIPFANLTWPGGRKRHGIQGAKQARGAARSPARRPRQRPPSPARRSPAAVSTGGLRSQRVTEKDIAAGRIRFPRSSKAVFPPERAEVGVVLRGEPLMGRWDPRTGPDRERSGVLTVGRDAAARRVVANDVLTVSTERGRVHLD